MLDLSTDINRPVVVVQASTVYVCCAAIAVAHSPTSRSFSRWAINVLRPAARAEWMPCAGAFGSSSKSKNRPCTFPHVSCTARRQVAAMSSVWCASTKQYSHTSAFEAIHERSCWLRPTTMKGNHCRSCWIRLCWHVPQALFGKVWAGPNAAEAPISSDHQGPALALSSLDITSVASLNSQLGAAAEGSALVGRQPPLPACSKFLPEVRTPTKRPKAEAVLPLLRRKARPSPVARD